MSEAVSEAAARLERAVGRLAQLLAQPRPPAGVDSAQVGELAARLDGALSRLRGALSDLDGAEPSLHDPLRQDPLAQDSDSRGTRPPHPGAEDDRLADRSPPPSATIEDEER